MRDLAFVPTAKKTLLCDRRNPGGRFGPLRYIGPPTLIVTFNTSQGFAGIYVPPHGRRNDSNGMGRSCVCLFWLRRSPSRGENAEAASGQSIGHVALESGGDVWRRSRRAAGTALDHAKCLI